MVTETLLEELGCGGIPKLNVMNKADAAECDMIFEDSHTVLISAKEHSGFDRLLDCITKLLPETARRMQLMVPYDKTSLISRIREEGKVFSEEYTAEGTQVDALVDIKLVKEAEKYTLS